jgi:hypothetical protein
MTSLPLAQLLSQPIGASEATDNGYGEDCAQEPPTKKRRFERRNSKTPAMLMKMQSSLMNFKSSKLDEEVEGEEKSGKKQTKETSGESDKRDGSREIAEELVMHPRLQTRRQNRVAPKSA